MPRFRRVSAGISLDFQQLPPVWLILTLEGLLLTMDSGQFQVLILARLIDSTFQA